MLRRNYSLILAGIWLFIGLALVFPNRILPEKYQQLLRDPGGAIGGIGLLAFVFAAYNLTRWWGYRTLYRNRKAARAVNPLVVRKIESEPEYEEPNPALDFVKLPDAEPTHPPKPSVNGDHKG